MCPPAVLQNYSFFNKRELNDYQLKVGRFVMVLMIMNSLKNIGRTFSNHPLTRNAPLKAWARFVAWQMHSRMQGEVIFPWIEGQRLAIRRGMTGATGNIYLGLHEFPDMMLPLHFLREGDLFLDIGSNIGSYTVLASGVRRATTWAFEPDPEAIRALRRNVELNGIQDRVTIHEFALSDTDGEVSFTRGQDTTNHVATKGETNVRTVSTRKLDTLIGTNRPLMIKMDVEGFEESVVRGAKGLLAGDSLKLIELETITEEIEATFNRHGFVRTYYDPFDHTLSKCPGKLSPSNAVFVRDWTFVAARLASALPVNVLGRSI
jgi:FkbM family methyltransferase